MTTTTATTATTATFDMASYVLELLASGKTSEEIASAIALKTSELTANAVKRKQRTVTENRWKTAELGTIIERMGRYMLRHYEDLVPTELPKDANGKPTGQPAKHVINGTLNSHIRLVADAVVDIVNYEDLFPTHDSDSEREICACCLDMMGMISEHTIALKQRYRTVSIYDTFSSCMVEVFRKQMLSLSAYRTMPSAEREAFLATVEGAIDTAKRRSMSTQPSKSNAE